MTIVLSGKKLAKKIKAMLAEPEPVRCAVAFWGPHIANLAKSNNAEVILNINIGGTSKNALLALGAPENKNVRVLEHFHSKIYIGSKGAIIGSANASSNALGKGSGKPSLEEAGVWISKKSNSKAYEDVEILFEQYKKKSKQVYQADIDRAPRFSNNAAGRDIWLPKDDTKSILNSLRNEPDNFSKTAFIFCDEKAESSDIAQANIAYEKELPLKGQNSPKRTFICTNCNEHEEAILRESTYVIMYWFGKGSGYYVYHDIVPVQVDEKITAFYGECDWSTVVEKIGLDLIANESVCWKNENDKARQFMIKESNNKKGKHFFILRHDKLYSKLESQY